jgi:hypothetical protein
MAVTDALISKSHFAKNLDATDITKSDETAGTTRIREGAFIGDPETAAARAIYDRASGAWAGFIRCHVGIR